MKLVAALLVSVGAGIASAENWRSPVFVTDDFVYVSGIEGRDAASVIDQLASRLRSVRLDLRHVVSVNVYVTDVRLLPRVETAWARRFHRDAPARTMLEAKLADPDATVSVSAIAAQDITRRRAIRPETWPEPRPGFSYAIEAADTLFLSALMPVDMARDRPAGDTIQEQTSVVMRNQETVLAAAGMRFAELVASRIFLVEPSHYQGLNDAYREFVTAPPPARATVHASTPVIPGGLLQIQSVGVRGSGEGRPSGDGITSPIHSYSVKAGKRLYITGMTGRRADGTFARNNVRAQVVQSLKTIEEQLRRNGMTFRNVADTTVWLRDMRDLDSMKEAYAPVMGDRPPACSVVGIPPNSPDGLVEIMMLAVE